MMLRIFKKNIVALLLIIPSLEGVSIVYNLRISETTKRQTGNNPKRRPHMGVLTLVNQIRKRRNTGELQHIFCALASINQSKKRIYAKVDFALGRVQQQAPNFYCKRAQLDDILFSLGYEIKASSTTKFTVSGLLGVPTHKDVGLTGIQLGTGHVGLGAQIDGSYLHATERATHQLLGATRLIHFLPNQVPVLNQTECFKFWPGDLIDVFMGYHLRIKKHNVEVGYNPSFLTDTKILPVIFGFTDQTNYVRNSFYANYNYVFKIRDHFAGVGIGTSYSFDVRPRLLGFKNIFTLWGALGVNF